MLITHNFDSVLNVAYNVLLTRFQIFQNVPPSAKVLRHLCSVRNQDVQSDLWKNRNALDRVQCYIGAFVTAARQFLVNENNVNNQRTDTASRNVSTTKLKINIAFWFSFLVARQLARSQSQTASTIFQPTDQMRSSVPLILYDFGQLYYNAPVNLKYKLWKMDIDDWAGWADWSDCSIYQTVGVPGT